MNPDAASNSNLCHAILPTVLTGPTFARKILATSNSLQHEDEEPRLVVAYVTPDASKRPFPVWYISQQIDFESLDQVNVGIQPRNRISLQ